MINFTFVVNKQSAMVKKQQHAKSSIAIHYKLAFHSLVCY